MTGARPPRGTSLRWRFAVWLFGALVGVSGLLAVYYQLRIDRLMAREADDRLTALARHLASGSLLGALARSEELLQGTFEGALSENDVLAVAVFDQSGGLISSQVRPGAAVPAWADSAPTCQPCDLGDGRLRWAAPVMRRRASGGPDARETFYDRPPPGDSSPAAPIGWLVLEVSTQRRQADERRVFRSGLLISGGALLLALVLTLLVAERFTSPLRALAAATREIGRGRWDAPLPAGSHGEIAQLADDFRAMTGALAELDRENRLYREQLEEMVRSRTRELQGAYDQMKTMSDAKDQFVATVSHDFRSPLAVILSCIQTIEADVDMPPATRRSFLERAQRQCKRLGALVSDLLDLARIENREAVMERTSLGQIAEDVLEGHRALFEARDVRIAWRQPPSPIFANVDRGQVERAIANLLDNAAKFTPPSGLVSIGVGRRDGTGVISVSDTGPGIPAEDLAHVFERFFQGQRGLETGKGSGLGLAIVAGVARRHGGSVGVESDAGKGTTFELRLPVDDQPRQNGAKVDG